MNEAENPARGAEDPVGARLNDLLSGTKMEPLSQTQLRQFASLLSLILRWNTRVNLTAIRTEEGILTRHFVESIACARTLPPGIATLLDFGSGAGFPGIPVALCRPEIAVTLAESQGKKAAFLQEAIRVLELPAKVYSGRAETLGSLFDCVCLRAVDRMPEAVTAAARLVAPNCWLALLTSGASLPAMHAAAGTMFIWKDPVLLPGSEDRALALAQRGNQ